MLAEVMDAVADQLAADGRAAWSVEPDRIVVGLDADNVTQAWVTAVDRDSLLSVQVRSRRRVPRAVWPDALRRVNAWNSAQSLAAAWLAVDDWATSDDGAIVVEACLPVCRDQEVEPIVRFV